MLTPKIVNISKNGPEIFFTRNDGNLDMRKEEGLFIFDCSQDPFAQHVF